MCITIEVLTIKVSSWYKKKKKKTSSNKINYLGTNAVNEFILFSSIVIWLYIESHSIVIPKSTKGATA